MTKRKPNRFILLWKAELKAAEAAADRMTELAHRALARHYAQLAAAACGMKAAPVRAR